MVEQRKINIYVFGAEEVCASCAHLPSSKETYEWLEAAITRKFPKKPFNLTYVDIYNPPDNDEIKNVAKTIIDDDWFYPVVVVENKIVGSGDIRLKTIFEEMEHFGYSPENK